MGEFINSMDGEIVRLEDALLAGDDVGLARGALIASGVATMRELNSYLGEIDGLARAIARGIGVDSDDLEKARGLFGWLWRGKPDRYEPGGSFRLNEVVDAQAGSPRRRVGNCLGLTILYNVLAHDFGLDATAVHLEEAFGRGPHVFTTLHFTGLTIDVENILPGGFDYRGHHGIAGREEWGDRQLIADLYHSMGTAYFERGRYEYAVALYEKALRLHPGYVRAHLNRGMALAELGELEQAADEFRKAALQ
jgi:tetratricopeptide (TPR) repeat protein